MMNSQQQHKPVFRDLNGSPVSFGDIVKITMDDNTSFYVKVTDLGNRVIPFDVFDLLQIKKVCRVPLGAVRLPEKRYQVWVTGESVKSFSEILRTAILN